jgi:hypothetical protein
VTVTKARLDALRDTRHGMNEVLHLRPDDATVAYVHSSLEAERIGELNEGDKVMQFAHNQFTEAIQKARHQGVSRAQFNRQSRANEHTHALNP